MKLVELFESDDWEAEEQNEEWSSIKVQPREGSNGWDAFEVTGHVFDKAFGKDNWGQIGIPKDGSFDAMHVLLRPGTKINYAPIRDAGYKIVFFEGHSQKQMPQVSTLEGLPNRIFIGKSFYLERHDTVAGVSFDVKRFLDDEPIGVVYMLHDYRDGWCWTFRLTKRKFDAETVARNVSRPSLFPSVVDRFSADVLKTWMKGELDSLGLLKDDANAK